MGEIKNKEWVIEYDNDVGASDEFFSQWWYVTDGETQFKAFSEEDAKFLCNTLNNVCTITINTKNNHQ